jgi:hypothetical protein
MQKPKKKFDISSFDKTIRYLERMVYPVALLIAAFGLAYWYWTTTPSYALTAVVVSVKNRDVEMFEKFVDIDSVTSHAFDDLINGPIAAEVIGGRSGGFLGMGFVKFFKREIIEMAHDKVVNYIAEGNVKLASDVPASVNPITTLAVFNSGQIVQATVKDKTEVLLPAPAHESKNDKLKRSLKEFGISKFGYRGIKYLKIIGPRALLGIEFFSPKLNKNWTANFQLEDAGGYWRVTELANLDEIVKMYLESRNT